MTFPLPHSNATEGNVRITLMSHDNRDVSPFLMPLFRHFFNTHTHHTHTRLLHHTAHFATLNMWVEITSRSACYAQERPSSSGGKWIPLSTTLVDALCLFQRHLAIADCWFLF